MSEFESFKATKNFSDKVNFPYGFLRSGDFSTKQARLLEQHGVAYKALEEAEREPVTAEETAFVAFCKGEKAAESDHEKVWEKYRKQSAGKSFYVSMAGAKPLVSEANQSSYDAEAF